MKKIIDGESNFKKIKIKIKIKINSNYFVTPKLTPPINL